VSKPKRFPVYVVRAEGRGCGHQHRDEQRARHCAQNTLQRLGLARLAIVAVTSEREHTLDPEVAVNDELR
jgi:hypothetical protein